MTTSRLNKTSFINRRRIFFVLAVVIIISLTGYLLSLPIEKVFFSLDFSEYWAASRLTLRGENAYSLDQLYQIQTKELNWPYPIPWVMYNPPWALGIILPLGLLPYTVARLVWLLLSIIITLICSDMAWQLYQGSAKLRWIGWIVGIFFLPTIFCLNSGQITPLILLGLVGFIYFVNKQKWVLAGCMVFLVSIKPQLLVLFWLALLLWVIKSKKWIVLLSALSTGIVALVIPLVFNPHIIPQYIEFSRNNLIYYYGIPLLSYALRAWFGLDKYWLQFVPMIFGIGWFILYWRRHTQDWRWLEHLPLVILVSFITASYGWIFDEIVFVPVLILITIWLANNIRQRWIVIAMYAGISFLMIEGYLANKQPNPWDLVQPLAFLGVYLVVAAKIQREKVEITGTG